MTPARLRSYVVALAALLCLISGCKKTPKVAAEFQYDSAGNLVSSTSPDGRKTSFKRDSHGLLTEVDSPDGSAHYGYDAHNNRIWVRDDAGATEYYYDAFDKLSATIWNRGPARLIAYEYDHTGLPSRISVFDLQTLANDPKFSSQISQLTSSSEAGAQEWHERERLVLDLAEQLRSAAHGADTPWLANDISYVRNLQGDLKEIRSGAGTVEINRSADASRVERILPNGVHSVFSYTPDGRLSQLRHTDSSGREIASFDYNYDSAGSLKNITGAENGRPINTSYDWDDRGRLRKITSGQTEFRYRYDDSLKNLAVTSGGKTVSFTFDSLGRIATAKGVALVMTAEGTMSARRDDNETTNIRYNYQGHPQEISNRNAKTRYGWDGEGNLVSLTRNGSTVHVVPAAGTGIQLPLLESGEQGAPESQLLIGATLLARIRSGAAEFYLENASGDAGFAVNGQGLLEGATEAQASVLRDSRSHAALRPAGLTRLNRHDRGASAFLALAQANQSGGGSNSDPFWYEPLVQVNQWEESFWKLPIGQGLRTNAGYAQHVLQQTLDVVDSQAQLNMQRGGAWRWLGYAETVGANQVLGDWNNLSKALVGVANYYSSPSQQNLKAMNKTWAPIAIQGATLFVGGKIEDALKPLLANRWASQNLPVLYKDFKPDLDSAVENGSLKTTNLGLITASWGIAHHSAKDAVWLGSKLASVGEGIIEATQLDKALNQARDQRKLGGVELASEVQGNIGIISGAVYDPASSSIVLLSDNNRESISGLTAEDFAVALRLAYADAPQDPAFSLDPADHNHPDGPWLQKVYYPDEILAGTDFGKAMFDADWLLKQYSFGVVAEPGKVMTQRTSAVPGFKSVAQLSLGEGQKASKNGSWSRFWIVSGAMKVRREGTAIVFDKVSMGVKTKPLVVDPHSKTGLSDDNSVKDPINEEFARIFTEHYDELAAESPALERVRELGKAVAIAKWLRENNIPVDLEGMKLDSMGLQKEDPDARRLMPTLSTSYKKVTKTAIHEHNEDGILTSTTELFLVGGVDLKVSPDYREDAKVGELQKVVQDQAQKTDDPLFQVRYQGDNFTGTRIRLSGNRPAQQMTARTIVRDGNLLRLNSQDQIVELNDRGGGQARYRDPALGEAGGVEITDSEGLHTLVERTKHGLTYQMTSTRGNQFNVTSGADGSVESISIDGKPWAEFHTQGTGRSVQLHNAGYSEVINFDSNLRVTGYELNRPGEAGKTLTESAKIEYAADGQPTRVSGDGMDEMNWKYDDSGRLQQASSSNGSSVVVTYVDGTAKRILTARTLKEGNTSTSQDVAKFVFDGDRLLSIESTATGKTDFEYDHEQLSAVNSERLGQTTYSYYQDGRPSLVEPPSGPGYRLKFGDRSKSGSVEGSGFKIQMLEPGPWRKPKPKRPQDASLRIPTVQRC